MADEATRDRVRALVRDVLSKAMPAETAAAQAQMAGSSPPLNAPTGAAAPAVTRDESAKLVITEDDVRGLERGAVLRIAEGARLTPLAADIVSDRGIEIVRRIPHTGSKQQKMIAVGSDHGGFAMKQLLIARLRVLGHEVSDFGAVSRDPDDDYPDYIIPLARAVAAGEVERGIVICGSGVGASVAANKVRGIRAGLCHDHYSVRQGVEDDDMNVLCLGGRVMGIEVAWDHAQTFVSSRFSGADRHRRRLSKVAQLDA